jgi:serine/threonine-protein kinase HipA
VAEINAIEVRIWGRRVGAVAMDPGNGFYVFRYDPKWIRSGIELAPRTMPVAGKQDAFSFPNLNPETYHRLPAMLADALPDDFGNALVNHYLTSRGRALESITMLDRLAYMGKRGVGALEFKPAIGIRKDSAEAIEMKDLVEAAREAVHGQLSSEPETRGALRQIISVGTSAGGRRAQLRTCVHDPHGAADRLGGRGRVVPAHGLQRHGAQLRRPHQEPGVPAAGRRALGAGPSL